LLQTIRRAFGEDQNVLKRKPCGWAGKGFGVGGSEMETMVETVVLIVAIAMVAPLPLEEIVGGYGRLALAILGFLLIFRWLFKNDQKKDLRGEL
jgi:hypothetical protein